jgi:hypothetical protein
MVPQLNLFRAFGRTVLSAPVSADGADSDAFALISGFRPADSHPAVFQRIARIKADFAIPVNATGAIFLKFYLFCLNHS